MIPVRMEQTPLLSPDQELREHLAVVKHAVGGKSCKMA